MSFFTATEVEYFHQVMGRTYRRGVLGDEEVGKAVSNGVWAKTETWAKSVKNSITGFSVSFTKMWLKFGQDQGHVAQIKPYTWARIFKPEDINKGIYFTIGVDAGRQSLLINIHYQEQAREQTKSILSPAQKQLCEQLIKGSDGWFNYCQEVPLNQIDEYSLERLTRETLAFIRHYESTYNLIIQLIWSTSAPRVALVPVELSPKPNAVVGKAYLRPERMIEPERIHALISQLLYNKLTQSYGSGKVRLEWSTASNTRVDIIRQEGNELIFYEIKAYPSVRTSILREAVGQLLEYGYWPGHQLAKELIIVTPLQADPGVRIYMNTLRTTLNLPIWYQQYDLFRNMLGDKV